MKKAYAITKAAAAAARPATAYDAALALAAPVNVAIGATLLRVSRELDAVGWSTTYLVVAVQDP